SHLESKIAQNILGLDLSELTFASLEIQPSKTKDRPSRMAVFEIGLSEFFACLMVRSLRKSNVPKGAYLLSRQIDSLTPLYTTVESYCLAYDKRAASAVEEAIRLADSLTAVISGIKYAQDKANEAKSLLEFEKVQRIAAQRAKRNVRRRREMWMDIDQGLDLLLSDRRNPNNPYPNDSVELHHMRLHCTETDCTRVFGYLMLHGHQLRRWIKQPQFFRLPEGVRMVLIGHYHLKMATIRHGLWIIFCGCFVNIISGQYVLSHIGCPRIEMSPDMHCPQFVIDRSAGIASSR
ncbi:hypothetical protein KA005_25345, partial [bacterium]|nr:hypothetical protein [bacterium]